MLKFSPPSVNSGQATVKRYRKVSVYERTVLTEADPQGHCEPVENRRGNLIPYAVVNTPPPRLRSGQAVGAIDYRYGEAKIQ